MDTTFKGRAKRLDDIDLPKIGRLIEVGEDELHAFMDVESSGSGFDSHGRPKMLFEPHIFYRLLGPGQWRDLAVTRGLAYEKQGTRPYPADSYPRLIEAMKISRYKALQSASWGLTQILGSNFRAAGYGDVEEMVTDFMEDEENHLEAAVKFIIANHIDDDIRAHRWDVVARVYNGPAYAAHGYHTKLAAAYAKWSKIKDTPWDGQEEAPAVHVEPPAAPPAPSAGMHPGLTAVLLAAAAALATGLVHFARDLWEAL